MKRVKKLFSEGTMAIRERLKSAVQGILGAKPPPPAAPVRPAPAAPAQAAPAPSPAPVQAAPVAPVQAPPAPAKPAAPVQAAPAAPAQAAPAAPEKSAADEEKQRRFRERARRGVLKYIDEHGGVVGLADVHDYSERKYFIAHKGFSKMMEEFVDEGHIRWDPSQGLATLTDEGRAFMVSPIA